MKTARAFTLLELLVVVAVIGILAALLLGAVGRAKGSSQRVACARNLQQLDLAALLYVSENNSQFPPPSQAAQAWPTLLKLQSGSPLVQCPTDLSSLRQSGSLSNHHRSYLMNGFSDFYTTTWGITQAVSIGKLGLPPIKEGDIKRPSQTILFGEKADSSLALEVNVFKSPGTYLDDISENRHGNVGRTVRGGGANFAFVDGSVQYLPWGKSTCPINLWAVVDHWRTDSALCRAR